jgi:hypothetical protein
MSEADEYRQYAEEAMRWVSDCKDPKKKLVLISLVRTWLRAAGRSDSPVVGKKPAPEHRAA